jgi:hypothetical protein
MERVTDYLLGDHERLRGLLARARSGPEVDREAYASFRAGLLRHIAIEEKLLFPAAGPLSRARALRADHAAIAALLARAPDLARCGALADLLARHDAVEEGPEGVYAECERALGEEASADLARRARDYREVRVAPYR